ncbi:hypothetical protein AB0K49_31120 [Streptomyces decoyicus]
MGLTEREQQQAIAEIRQLTAQVDALSRRAQRQLTIRLPRTDAEASAAHT